MDKSISFTPVGIFTTVSRIQNICFLSIFVLNWLLWFLTFFEVLKFFSQSFSKILKSFEIWVLGSKKIFGEIIFVVNIKIILFLRMIDRWSSSTCLNMLTQHVDVLTPWLGFSRDWSGKSDVTWRGEIWPPQKNLRWK